MLTFLLRSTLLGIISLAPLVKSFAQNFEQTGIASYYADKFEGRTTANGEKYKHSKFTAAHRTLPFGTMVKVKNLENNKEVTVRINDRGPFVEGRIIDLSKSAAKELGYINQGITKVKITAKGSPKQTKKAYSTLDHQSQENINLNPTYYQISAKSKKLAGFGVQIGSFNEMMNMVELVEDLQKKYNDCIFIQTSVIQNVKQYKIIIGNEKNREKAEKLRSKLKGAFPDSFIIKY